MRNLLRLKFVSIFALAIMFVSIAANAAQAQTTTPTVRIVVPERFRVLTNQYFDLRIEAENLSSIRGRIQVNVLNENGSSEAVNFAGPFESTTNNDSNTATADRAITYRRMSFTTPGIKTIQAIVTDGRRIFGFATQISVQDFNLIGQKSIVLFIGDAMGQAYRDSSRIVAQSTANRFREGFFDQLQQMDVMPVTGSAMTYSLETIVPDSANTASAWANGNKTINGALNVFPDNTDFKYNPAQVQATKQFALDNPRVETLWQFLKRRHGYKTGIVTTSEVTDATPAGEGAHTITRTLQFDIAKQYVDGSINAGVQFDVIMGGAKERFDARTAANSGDTRNLVQELQASGFSYVTNRAELNALPSDNTAPNRILGLFRTGNMNVAYDKLGLVRPPDEPAPNFAGFPNQPFVDEMTSKALATLSKDNSPFILMVEGASIDKQSHPNYAAGQIWDNIEMDKAVGVGRQFLNRSAETRANTLLVTTADHDQSMHILGTVDTNVPSAVQNVISTLLYPNGNRGQGSIGAENAVGEVEAFPNYEDQNGDRYPENTNRYRIKVGYRTGNHTGSSVPVSAEGAGALLFFGHYDQTDLFFKMAKTLSLNTAPLDAALQQKLGLDVPVFNPDQQLRHGQPDKNGVVWLSRPMLTPVGDEAKQHSCGIEEDNDPNHKHY